MCTATSGRRSRRFRLTAASNVSPDSEHAQCRFGCDHRIPRTRRIEPPQHGLGIQAQDRPTGSDRTARTGPTCRRAPWRPSIPPSPVRHLDVLPRAARAGLDRNLLAAEVLPAYRDRPTARTTNRLLFPAAATGSPSCSATHPTPVGSTLVRLDHPVEVPMTRYGKLETDAKADATAGSPLTDDDAASPRGCAQTAILSTRTCRLSPMSSTDRWGGVHPRRDDGSVNVRKQPACAIHNDRSSSSSPTRSARRNAIMHCRSTCSIGCPKPRSTPSDSAAYELG